MTKHHRPLGLVSATTLAVVLTAGTLFGLVALQRGARSTGSNVSNAVVDPPATMMPVTAPQTSAVPVASDIVSTSPTGVQPGLHYAPSGGTVGATPPGVRLAPGESLNPAGGDGDTPCTSNC
jgi:hypothetical protein